MENIEKSLCEEKTYSVLFRSYSKNLFNYLYYKSGDKNLAQDIMQESFLKLWQNCKKVIFKTAESYVFTTANNLLKNNYKHEQVKFKFNRLEKTDRSNIDPLHELLQKEFNIALDKAISDLSEKQRVVFLLSRIDKLTYKEIALQLGISKQAVEKRMYLALAELRKVSKNIK